MRIIRVYYEIVLLNSFKLKSLLVVLFMSF